MYFSAQQSGITVFSVHKLTAFAFILVLWIWKIEPRKLSLRLPEFGGSILENGHRSNHGFGGSILEIRRGAMDFGDRSLKFTLTLDLGE